MSQSTEIQKKIPISQLSSGIEGDDLILVAGDENGFMTIWNLQFVVQEKRIKPVIGNFLE